MQLVAVAMAVGRDLDCRGLGGRRIIVKNKEQIPDKSQIGGTRLVREYTVLESESAIGHRQRRLDELFDQQHCRALLPEHVDHLKQLAHDRGREALRHLVDHQ